jgi:hypothetical protein
MQFGKHSCRGMAYPERSIPVSRVRLECHQGFCPLPLSHDPGQMGGDGPLSPASQFPGSTPASWRWGGRLGLTTPSKAPAPAPGTEDKSGPISPPGTGPTQMFLQPLPCLALPLEPISSAFVSPSRSLPPDCFAPGSCLGLEHVQGPFP